MLRNPLDTKLPDYGQHIFVHLELTFRCPCAFAQLKYISDALLIAMKRSMDDIAGADASERYCKFRCV